jgi:hypothetical protein
MVVFLFGWFIGEVAVSDLNFLLKGKIRTALKRACARNA